MTESRTILPSPYKKRMLQGVAAWALTAAVVGGWLLKGADEAAKDWNARVPQASASVRQTYLTPQITDKAHPDFNTAAPDAASAAPAAPGGPVVTLIMTDLGLSDALTRRAIDDLPPQVALAFSPYSELPKWIKRAADAKHEAIVLLPMEPVSYPKDDPGPKALLSRASATDNAHNLDALMDSAKGAYGAMNFMGSAFLGDRENLSAVYGALRKQNLVFVENRTGRATPAGPLAAENSMPYIATDSAIDASATETDVSQKLIELEKLARKQGYAVGVTAPYPVAFNVIKNWSDGLSKRGVTLAPLSAALSAEQAAAAGKAQNAEPPAATPQ
jgi:polysaccharide deacetylase 2 family uncharacterized protein YibQ